MKICLMANIGILLKDEAQKPILLTKLKLTLMNRWHFRGDLGTGKFLHRSLER